MTAGNDGWSDSPIPIYRQGDQVIYNGRTSSLHPMPDRDGTDPGGQHSGFTLVGDAGPELLDFRYSEVEEHDRI